MINLLFTIVLGTMQYTVISDCSQLARVRFALDDSKNRRVLYICTDYPDQLNQLLKHELLHICMHNHEHHFKTPQELDFHLHKQQYLEEQVVTELAPCLIEDENVLYTALEKHHVHIPRDG